jgi:dTDP-4-amino-4,6-dideoxygalactose transaminase
MVFRMTESNDDRPAILGGAPIRPQGPPGWPIPDADVENALRAAYENGTWGRYHGPALERLETRLAEAHDVSYAQTCSSGTLAVELGLRALGVRSGDEVILSAYDYPGNFLSVHAIGALPVLVDVSANDWNVDPERIRVAIGPKTRAVVASHLHGGIVRMAEVMAVCRERGVAVLEDAAQIPGAIVQGRQAGTWGDVGVLSFGGSKLLTAGRGGALLTNRANVAQRLRVLLRRGANLPTPMAELQAVVLLPQLDKLADRNRRRAESVAGLRQDLAGIADIALFGATPADSTPGYYKVGMRFDAERFGMSRDRFTAAMRAEGIALDAGFAALHMGRSSARYRASGALTEAERAHRECVILHHPILLGSQKDLSEIAAALRKLQRHADEIRTRT